MHFGFGHICNKTTLSEENDPPDICKKGNHFGRTNRNPETNRINNATIQLGKPTSYHCLLMRFSSTVNHEWGTYVVFFGRHIVGFRAQILLAAGVMRMSAIKFLMADAISALFTIGLWGGVGYLGGNSIQVLKKDMTRMEHMAIVVLVILIASGIIFWHFKNVKKIKKT